MVTPHRDRDASGSPELVGLLLDAAKNYIGQRKGTEAQACLDQVLGVLSSGPAAERARALVLLGSAREIQGDLGGAESAWQEAREIQESVCDHLGAAETYYHLASLRRARGDLREARAHLLTSLQYSASAPPGAIRARALEDLCPVERRLGDPGVAQERLKEALRIREALGHTREMAIDHDHLGNIDLSQGRHEDAVAHYEKALALFDKLEHRGGAALVCNNLGLARMHRGEYDLAASCFERSRSLYTEMGDERRLAWCVGNLGLLKSYRGRVAEARSLLEESLERIEPVGDSLGRATFLNNLAMVFRMAGDIDSSVEAARRAIDTMTELGLVEGSASPWTNLSLAELDRGDLEAARRAAARVSELTGSSRSPGTRCDTLILRATIAIHEEEFATASALAEEARLLAERNGQPREKAEALRLEGEAQLRAGNTPAARSALLAAHSACRNLGDLFQTSLCRLHLGELFLSVDSVEAAGRHLRQSADAFLEAGNDRLRWRALLLLSRAEWPLSQDRALTTLALARELAKDQGRADWTRQVSEIEETLRSGGARTLAVDGSVREIAEVCRLAREARDFEAGLGSIVQQVSNRHSLIVTVAWDRTALDRGSRAPEIDPDMGLVAQTAWASGQPQYAWPDAESDADGEAPFVVATPIAGRGGDVLGVLVVRGAEDGVPSSPRPPRLWWFLQSIGETLSLWVVAHAGRGESAPESTLPTRLALFDSSSGEVSSDDADGGAHSATNDDGVARVGGSVASGSIDPWASAGADIVLPAYADLVGSSAPMRALYQMIERVAPTDSTVLVHGESGTGKELVARALHRGSPRASGPFVAISCPSIPRELIEAELFGYERGAFTGATAKKDGQVLLAEGGTLFLDEIGDIDIPTQTKLLRFLQEREFVPVGGRHPIRVDIRLVAATSRNLEDEVRDGRLREDLYYRLSVVPLRIAPLRERADDVPRLVRYFLDRMAEREGLDRIRISPAALDHLTRYTWPGNVRELRNVIEYLVALHRGSPLELRDLPEKIVAANDARGGIAVAPGTMANGSEKGRGAETHSALRAGETLEARVMSVEGSLIRETLERCGGNQSKAARLLGIKESTMRNKMKRYGITGASQRLPGRGSSRSNRGGKRT